MSQIKIFGERHFVLAGWDPVIGRFYVDIYEDADDDYPLYESDVDKKFYNQEGMSVIDKLKEHEVEIPIGFLDVLVDHRTKNVGNEIVSFRRTEEGGWARDGVRMAG